MKHKKKIRLLVYTLLSTTLFYSLFSIILFLKLTHIPPNDIQISNKKETISFIKTIIPNNTLSKETLRLTPMQINDQYFELVKLIPDQSKRKKETILIIHGHSVSKFTPKIFKLAYELYINDYSVILLDLYPQRIKKHHFTSLGFNESKRVSILIQHLINSGYKKNHLILYGESLGATTALLSGIDLNLPTLILDSPFTTIPQIISNELQKKGIPVFTKHAGLIVGKYLFKIPLYKSDPIPKINKQFSSNILLIHSTKDTVVPITHSKRLMSHCQQFSEIGLSKWFHNTEGHCNMMSVNKKEYINRITQFIEKTKNKINHEK